MTQLDLLDAIAARDEAMRRVEDNADVDWAAYMERCIARIAKTMPLFTSDDVFELAASNNNAPTTHEPRALGPLMVRAAKSGLCAATETFRQSVRRSRHAAPLRVWRSLILGRAS